MGFIEMSQFYHLPPHSPLNYWVTPNKYISLSPKHFHTHISFEPQGNCVR